MVKKAKKAVLPKRLFLMYDKDGVVVGTDMDVKLLIADSGPYMEGDTIATYILESKRLRKETEVIK